MGLARGPVTYMLPALNLPSGSAALVQAVLSAFVTQPMAGLGFSTTVVWSIGVPVTVLEHDGDHRAFPLHIVASRGGVGRHGDVVLRNVPDVFDGKIMGSGDGLTEPAARGGMAKGAGEVVCRRRLRRGLRRWSN